MLFGQACLRTKHAEFLCTHGADSFDHRLERDLGHLHEVAGDDLLRQLGKTVREDRFRRRNLKNKFHCSLDDYC